MFFSIFFAVLERKLIIPVYTSLPRPPISQLLRDIIAENIHCIIEMLLNVHL